MPLVDAKCTNCGANLKVDSSKDAVICEFCGSAFVVEQAINNYNITNNVTNNINAQNVTIVNQGNSPDFEIVAGILKKYNGASPDVVIPEGVTEIDAGAIPDGVKTLTIPNSVTEIGESAFEGCSSLTSVTIPNSVTKIGESAFKDCSSLTSVTIPNSVTKIGESAFKGCSSLVSITIPNSVTEIDTEAFSACFSLTSVTIPNSVTEIGDRTFFSCASLTSVTIPNSVTEIGDRAFFKCTSLASITILGQPYIASNAFDNTPYKEQKQSGQQQLMQQQQQNQPKNSSGGCYVATCVYGSYDCPQVWTLRRYRDYTLAETWYGRAFIRAYYATSPTIVRLFGKTAWFRKLWRGKLNRMVADLQAKGFESTPYNDRNW